MAIKAVVCPQCTGQVNLDDSREFGFCTFCGTKILITQDIVNIHNTTNTDNSITHTENYHTQQTIHKTIIGKEQNEAEDYIRNGNTFLSLGEYGKAGEAFDSAVKANPGDYRCWLGFVKVVTKNYTDFLDTTYKGHLEKAIKVAPPDNIPDDLAKALSAEKVGFENYLRIGNDFLSQGKYDKATEAFSNAKNVNSADYRGWLGLATTATKNYTDFLDTTYKGHLEKAVKVAPHDNMPDDLAKALAKIAELENYIRSGNAFLSLGRYSDAQYFFEMSVKINPNDYRGWLGLVKTATKNYTDFSEKYKENLDKAKKLAPSGNMPDDLASAFMARDNALAAARIRIKQVRERFAGYRNIIAAGGYRTLGLKNGKAILAGDRGSVLRDIVAVAIGEGAHPVGLKANGTVVTTYCFGELRNVSEWRNIVAVAAGYHTVGLKSDGTVVAVGKDKPSSEACNVSGLRNITAIAASWVQTVGLKADGSVCVVGNKLCRECRGWTDIIAIAASGPFTVGLMANGTVVTNNDYDERVKVSDWGDIVDIAAGNDHIVGLKANGSVVAVGDNKHGQCNVSGWHNVVAIAAGSRHTVGLKSDGTVVAVGDNGQRQCNVSDWRLF